MFVPGTTTDLASVGRYNTRMEDVAYGNPDTTATITWMGTDLPDAVTADATFTSYTLTGGRHLTSFVEGLALSPHQELALVGHSAGGAIVGQADALGVGADRILHVASAGTGPGIDDAADYPGLDLRGQPRDVLRFSMTAPGDTIEIAQRSGDLGWLVPEDWGHGFDPDETRGFVRLETGRFTQGERAGERIEGLTSHGQVVTPGTDAFANIVG